VWAVNCSVRCGNPPAFWFGTGFPGLLLSILKEAKLEE
jgi:hypothetical protein